MNVNFPFSHDHFQSYLRYSWSLCIVTGDSARYRRYSHEVPTTLSVLVVSQVMQFFGQINSSAIICIVSQLTVVIDLSRIFFFCQVQSIFYHYELIARTLIHTPIHVRSLPVCMSGCRWKNKNIVIEAYNDIFYRPSSATKLSSEHPFGFIGRRNISICAILVEIQDIDFLPGHFVSLYLKVFHAIDHMCE